MAALTPTIAQAYIKTFQFSNGRRTVRVSVKEVRSPSNLLGVSDVFISGRRLFHADHANGPATEKLRIS